MQDILLTRDLERTLIPELWEHFRGASIFITGGTGFFGRWLLESFARANNLFELDASVLVLTRNLETFREKAPHLVANQAIKFHIGDVRNYEFPCGTYTHVIHAATTTAAATFNNEDPLVKFDTVAQGTRHTLDFAVRCKAKKFLLTSSGSVYGKSPLGMTHITEDYCGSPSTVDFSGSALGEGKRVAEFLCAYYAKTYGLETQIARCFSFVGPYLPLDIHYAIGNFIRDALFADVISVSGNGTPMRSYMYVGDLVIWLLTMIARGRSGRVYNVGSDQAISIHNLASLVRDTLSPGKAVNVRGQSGIGVGGDWYIPCIQRAREELCLDVWTSLQDAVRLTAQAAEL